MSEQNSQEDFKAKSEKEILVAMAGMLVNIEYDLNAIASDWTLDDGGSRLSTRFESTLDTISSELYNSNLPATGQVLASVLQDVAHMAADIKTISSQVNALVSAIVALNSSISRLQR